MIPRTRQEDDRQTDTQNRDRQTDGRRLAGRFSHKRAQKRSDGELARSLPAALAVAADRSSLASGRNCQTAIFGQVYILNLLE